MNLNFFQKFSKPTPNQFYFEKDLYMSDPSSMVLKSKRQQTDDQGNFVPYPSDLDQQQQQQQDQAQAPPPQQQQQQQQHVPLSAAEFLNSSGAGAGEGAGAGGGLAIPTASSAATSTTTTTTIINNNNNITTTPGNPESVATVAAEVVDLQQGLRAALPPTKKPFISMSLLTDKDVIKQCLKLGKVYPGQMGSHLNYTQINFRKFCELKGLNPDDYNLPTEKYPNNHLAIRFPYMRANNGPAFWKQSIPGVKTAPDRFPSTQTQSCTISLSYFGVPEKEPLDVLDNFLEVFKEALIEKLIEPYEIEDTTTKVKRMTCCMAELNPPDGNGNGFDMSDSDEMKIRDIRKALVMPKQASTKKKNDGTFYEPQIDLKLKLDSTSGNAPDWKMFDATRPPADPADTADTADPADPANPKKKWVPKVSSWDKYGRGDMLSPIAYFEGVTFTGGKLRTRWFSNKASFKSMGGFSNNSSATDEFPYDDENF